ncbi:IclR family transcriptional regulator [Cupriavidus sp. AcVe19-1a]|uniref:IclR family transcriptional regulator n=1 Tax=Cupriavidus sp. AcVe19-1a TaxID=2821359 RepID=UPI001AE4ED62|nr:IclR family transcriptional regulator [Cupriavidus sp. AcVe19-1a]MBP0630485.1 IclR family transcriptional regulator [Cupriavidus sp. AcVe19-1a]
MTDTSPPEKLVGALSSGLKVLRYLASSSAAHGVSRIAKDLDLNASTCFNLLKTLVHERLVTFDESTKTYSIALGLVELAKGSLEKASYVRLMRPHLQELAARHNITTTLWQEARDDRVVLVDLAESSSTMRIHMSIGQRLPRYIAALGRCMAAHSGLSVVELRRKVSELRWESGPSFETYMRDVEHVRHHGYAVDNGNYVKGVLTVSSPILDAQGHPLMAMSAVGFATQFSDSSLQALSEDLRERCREATVAISGGAITRLWSAES